MKIKLLILIGMLFVFTQVQSSAADGPSPPRSLAVSVIWDTSRRNKSDWNELSVLAKDIVSGLQTGDYLEVISAHRREGRIRVSQSIESIDPERVETLNTLLANIEPVDFRDADVASALEMGFERLDQRTADQHDSKVVVIVLTNGRLSDRQVERIRHLATAFKARGWHLYVTGTAKANKQLPIAASHGELGWSLIDRANPATWLAGARGPSAKAAPETPPQKPVSKPVPELPPKVEEIATTPDKAQARPTPAPLIRQAATKKETTFRATARYPIKIPEQQKTSQKPQPEPERGFPSLVMIAAGGVVCLVLAAAALLIPDLVRVLRQRLKARRRLAAQPKARPSILVATVDGQQHTLGPVASLRRLHIGSGPGNALRLAKEGIEVRHIRLLRRGSRWLVRNLSSKPVEVNNTRLNRGKTRQIRFPIGLQLTKKVGMRLAVVPGQDRQASISDGKTEHKDKQDE